MRVATVACSPAIWKSRTGTSCIWVAIVIVLSWACTSCGTSQRRTAPELPVRRTGDAGMPREDAGISPVVRDLWTGRELIVPPVAKEPTTPAMPPVHRFSLKNGLEVITVHDPALSVITLQLAIRAGTRQSIREKSGLVELAAQAMIRGGKRYTARNITQKLERIGGSFGASTSVDAIVFSCKSLALSRGTCMDILSDVVGNPSFSNDEIELIRTGLYRKVRRRINDARQLANAHIKSVLWGEHNADGWIASADTVAGITRTDVIAWHNAWVRPNNAVLVLAGNFNESSISRELEQSLGRWRRGETPAKREVVSSARSGASIRLVDKPGQVQAHIRIAQVERGHDKNDFFAMSVANHVLGGGRYSSRLRTAGQANPKNKYTAMSHFDHSLGRKSGGKVVVSIEARASEALTSLQSVQATVAEMAASGPTDAEVVAAQTEMIGSYSLRFGTTTTTASLLLAAQVRDMNREYVSEYMSKIYNVTRSQAASASASMFAAPVPSVVIVADARVVGPQLTKAGLAFELIEEGDAISDWERRVKADAERQAGEPGKVAAAVTLLDQALETKGGAEKIASIKGYRWRGEAQFKSGAKIVVANIEKQYLRPNRLRVDLSVDKGTIKITTAVDDAHGWRREVRPGTVGNGIDNYTEQELIAVRSQLWRDPELVLSRHRESGAITKLLGQEVVGEQVVATILIRSMYGDKVLVLIDENSKQLVGIDYLELGNRTSERFSDYRNVDGIQVAYKRSTRSAQVDLTAKISQFEINQTIDPSVFKRPTADSR